MKKLLAIGGFLAFFFYVTKKNNPATKTVDKSKAIQRLVDTLKKEEGFSSTSYVDSTGHSIGYGTFIDTSEEQGYLNKSITEAQAELLLRNDIAKAMGTVTARIKVPLSENQLVALTQLVYNTGAAPLVTGSLDDLINAEKGQKEISDKWAEYHYSNGQPNSNLLQRRQREINLYFTPDGFNG